MKFHLDRLLDYTDEDIIAEIKRVAALVPEKVLTRRIFDLHSRVAARTVRRRFGSWKSALERAGVRERYSGAPVTKKQLVAAARTMTDTELLDELRAVARTLGRDTITTREMDEHSRVGSAVFRRRFGSWQKAMKRVGLQVARSGQRFTDDELFENLLVVWTHYGRAPTYDEMREPPSCVTADTYKERFKTWNRALAAFVERANRDTNAPPQVEARTESARPEKVADDRRRISLGMRFLVLRRDRFRCTACGRSPATDPACILHVDHVIPRAKGGGTTEENLRSLCSDCNIGRGDRHED